MSFVCRYYYPFIYLDVKSDQKYFRVLTFNGTACFWKWDISLCVKRWHFFLLSWLAASLSESETSLKGCHFGEPNFSQKSAARRETGALRCPHSLQNCDKFYNLSALTIWNLTPSLFGSLPENTKLVDVYLFLFDEFLLITKMKRSKKVWHCSQSELHHGTYLVVCTEAS